MTLLCYVTHSKWRRLGDVLEPVDGDASFDDFSAFGGWTTPAIKQYEGSKTLCGAGVSAATRGLCPGTVSRATWRVRRVAGARERLRAPCRRRRCGTRDRTRAAR